MGHGRWGANHARAAATARGTVLKGVVDPRPAAREAARQRYGVRTSASLSQALSDSSVEAVVIATPAATHTEVVSEALRSGRHVLVEKPAAMNLAEAQMMAAEADARGLQLSAGHTFLYTQPVRNLARWLREAAPSTPWLVRSERLGGRRRTDCDVLWNFGPHDVSVLLHLLAEPVVEVTARGHRFPGGRTLTGSRSTSASHQVSVARSTSAGGTRAPSGRCACWARTGRSSTATATWTARTR
ncbi:Gfo/Idh/MocA family protein [Kitasatospora arboriphila]